MLGALWHAEGCVGGSREGREGAAERGKKNTTNLPGKWQRAWLQGLLWLSRKEGGNKVGVTPISCAGVGGRVCRPD